MLEMPYLRLHMPPYLLIHSSIPLKKKKQAKSKCTKLAHKGIDVSRQQTLNLQVWASLDQQTEQSTVDHNPNIHNKHRLKHKLETYSMNLTLGK